MPRPVRKGDGKTKHQASNSKTKQKQMARNSNPTGVGASSIVVVSGVVTLAVAVAVALWLQPWARSPPPAAIDGLPHTVPRSNLYWGTRTTDAAPFMTGLGWTSGSNIGKLRHAARHEDELQRWGWQRHDGGTFGEEFIGDEEHGLNVNVDFVKLDAATDNREHRSPWVVRISGHAVDNSGSRKAEPTSLFLSMSSEAAGLRTLPASTPGTHVVTGRDGGGSFAVVTITVAPAPQPQGLRTHLTPPPSSPSSPPQPAVGLEKTHMTAVALPNTQLWQVPDVIKQQLGASAQAAFGAALTGVDQPGAHQMMKARAGIVPLLNDNQDSNANLVVLQRVVELPFQIFMVYVPSANASVEVALPEALELAQQATQTEEFERLLQERRDAFEEKLEDKFGMSALGVLQDEAAMARAALSNLLGSLTYFHGASEVQYPDDDTSHPGHTHGLFTGVPSRSFFPRGFLWDEGFHQLLVAKWSPSTARTVLLSWLQSMDDDGWIAREQILGPEASSVVPEKFRVQRPDIANPPTLLLAVMELVNQYRASNSGSQHTNGPELKFFREAFPLLVRQHRWFLRTQGSTKQNAFYWRHTTADHCLASGLDDFPRGQVEPHPGDEHIDLLSWMALSSKLLSAVGSFLGEDVFEFEERSSNLTARIVERHWSSRAGVFCDRGAVRKKGKTKLTKICHVGYVTLFPFLLGLLEPNAPQLPALLSVMEDPEQLWSPFGLRSLSRSDPLFATKENYWRGAVWINCNFLALKTLKRLGATPGPVQERAQKLHDRLRQAVVSAVTAQYHERGFVYESYDSQTGHGRGTHPFTGWTALVVLIVGEHY